MTELQKLEKELEEGENKLKDFLSTISNKNLLDIQKSFIKKEKYEACSYIHEELKIRKLI